MRNPRATEIKVGITVLLGLLVFIWVLGWAKSFTLSSSDNQVKVRFDKVSGLEIGNNVTVNGVRKGHVKDFVIQGSYVIVTLSISNDIILKKDAEFSLESTDLMGGRKIEVNPGNSNEDLNLAEVHPGIYISDIAGMISLFSDIQDKIGIIANESVKTLQGINSLLEDETFIEGLRTSITNLNNVTAKLDKVITENQQNLKEITESTKEITADTKKLIKENKDKVELTLANLNSIMLRSDSLLTSLNYLTQETMTGENNLGKILYNDSLYNNLIQSMESINELTKLLKFQLETDGIKVDAYIF
ncbi:MAG: MlaD family protein [Ignavibacteriaceae bacterium]|jgi:phospholipid/cholesterol/gamma-HCH transport system substrate-binding protein|nr:MlaD family protein [Ignavibacteriaceae bacterium]